MSRWMSTAAIAALMVLPLDPAAVLAPSRTPPRPAVTARGCLITVTAWNKGTRQVAISRDSQVRKTVGVFMGPWAKLGLSEWIQPGQKRSWTYNLAFGCKTSRQYRFIVKQFDSHKNLLSTSHFYYPYGAPNHACCTPSESFSIGDLNRFFE